MNRRAFLAGAGITLSAASSGCLSSVPGIGPDITFERVDAQIDVDSPPELTVENERVIVQGTVVYGATDCSDLELAHADYEGSQERLDLLVAGVDDRRWHGGSCTDAAMVQGYRIEATRSGGFRYVSATEHHGQGETYSASFEQ